VERSWPFQESTAISEVRLDRGRGVSIIFKGGEGLGGTTSEKVLEWDLVARNVLKTGGSLNPSRKKE